MLQHIKTREDWNEKSFSAKGFTLIELLVVIVILGILAAVVVFAVGGITDKGQGAACQTEAKTVRTAAEAYAALPASNNQYAAATALTPGDPTDNGAGALVTAKLLSAGGPTLVQYTGGGATYGVQYIAGGKCLAVTPALPAP